MKYVRDSTPLREEVLRTEAIPSVGLGAEDDEGLSELLRVVRKGTLSVFVLVLVPCGGAEVWWSYCGEFLVVALLRQYYIVEREEEDIDKWRNSATDKQVRVLEGSLYHKRRRC